MLPQCQRTESCRSLWREMKMLRLIGSCDYIFQCERKRLPCNGAFHRKRGSLCTPNEHGYEITNSSAEIDLQIKYHAVRDTAEQPANKLFCIIDQAPGRNVFDVRNMRSHYIKSDCLPLISSIFTSVPSTVARKFRSSARSKDPLPDINRITCNAVIARSITTDKRRNINTLITPYERPLILPIPESSRCSRPVPFFRLSPTERNRATRARVFPRRRARGQYFIETRGLIITLL